MEGVTVLTLQKSVIVQNIDIEIELHLEIQIQCFRLAQESAQDSFCLCLANLVTRILQQSKQYYCIVKRKTEMIFLCST